MTKTIKGFALGVVVGALLMVSTYAVAGQATQYVLTKANYPIFVGGKLYEGNLPMLNFKGYTYAPLRAVSEIFGVKIFWNDALQQVEITPGERPVENSAFRNINVSGSKGEYTVTGEARVFEATFQYEVSDGHMVFAKGFYTTNEGAPAWSPFTLNVKVAQASLPKNGALTLALFEESAKDGSIINELGVTLEVFAE